MKPPPVSNIYQKESIRSKGHYRYLTSYISPIGLLNRHLQLLFQ